MFDISLLYELKKGNREAFNGVFRYYYPRIMAYTASMAVSYTHLTLPTIA